MEMHKDQSPPYPWRSLSSFEFLHRARNSCKATDWRLYPHMW